MIFFLKLSLSQFVLPYTMSCHLSQESLWEVPSLSHQEHLWNVSRLKLSLGFYVIFPTPSAAPGAVSWGTGFKNSFRKELGVLRVTIHRARGSIVRVAVCFSKSDFHACGRLLPPPPAPVHPSGSREQPPLQQLWGLVSCNLLRR